MAELLKNDLPGLPHMHMWHSFSIIISASLSIERSAHVIELSLVPSVGATRHPALWTISKSSSE